MCGEVAFLHSQVQEDWNGGIHTQAFLPLLGGQNAPPVVRMWEVVEPRSGFLGVGANGADRLFMAVTQSESGGKASSGTIKGDPEHTKGI